MLVTEEQAKEMWCPTARVLVLGPTALPPHNRVIHRDVEPRLGNLVAPASFCIGSRCMWWRWGTYERRGTIFKPTGPQSSVSTEKHLGYCGIAGKPENA